KEVEGGEPYLSTMATYGYQPTAAASQRFALGEGLVGQAAINKQPMYVDDVPSDYIRVVSGIGERQPIFIALIPILFQGRLRAVAEFASFRPLPTVHRELIGQLAATLGIVIDSISANQLTSKLLQESTDLAQRLEKERLTAIQANQSKSDFLANMSHEIRTPMNGILGTSELMLDCGLDSRQQQYAETIYHSSEMLLALINDILDFSKIEAGELTLQSAPFDLLRVIEDVAELLIPKALEKMIELSVRFVPGTPRFLIGDSVRIRQILCNLIGNAIKFTESGYVLITVEQIDGASKNEDSLTFRLSIKDTGIGIPEDKLDHVFGRFAQADGSTTRKYGGTGLGLAISKRLVELMGGSIGLESKVGEGSRFFFSVVLRRDADAQDSEPDRSLLEGVKLLIVDDIEVNRKILCEQVGAVGMNYATAESGQQAMQALCDAHREGQPFEFAILDYMMPGENGVQLAERISGDPDLAETILIMLSSAAPEIEQNSEARISSFLTKPARQMQLLDTLAALKAAKRRGRRLDEVEPISQRPSVKMQETDTALSGLRILLVEDNRVNRELIKENLGRLDCRVTTAENGKEAVAVVKEQTFDIILMDCQMPVMDGFEASRIISTMIADNEVAETPIIALTANAMQGDRERCLEAGMHDYASKPIRRKTLIDLLLRWCVTKENQAALASASNANPTAPAPRSAASPAEPVRPAEDTDGMPSSTAVDRELLVEARAMMGDQFPVVLEVFLEDAANYVDQIISGLAAKDEGAIATAARPLTSSSREVGAIELSKLAKAIEASALAINGGAGDLASIEPIAERLKTSFQEVRSQLEAVIAQGSFGNDGTSEVGVRA
ncbi:MAG: response regulator, partial [Alphaproteobacteria bacterium]|nr:response regulator [Alphaproteobacteria bacterium]